MSWMIKGICNLRDLFSDEGIDVCHIIWIKDRHTDLSITKLMKYAAIDGVELHKVVDSGEGWVVIILSGGYVKISHDGKEFKFKLTIKLSGVWI